MTSKLYTQFMKKLAQELKDDKDLAESTIRNIMSQLKRLNGGNPFENLVFLKKIDKVLEDLSIYKANTQKTYLSSVVSVLELLKDKRTYKTLLNKYKKLLDEAIQASKQIDKNNKNEKEKNNWMSWEEITSVKDNLQEKVDKIEGSPTKTDYNNILKYLVLSLYTDIPPRRNQDYQKMVINKKNKNLSDDFNHLVLDDNKFIFNKYKTSKSHGKQSIDFSDKPDLKRIIKQYLVYHPLYKVNKKNVPFLVDASGSPLVDVNSITRLLNKIFKKNVGSSMLRKIYISHKFGDDLDKFNEMKAVAEKMGHTVGTAQGVYNKG